MPQGRHERPHEVHVPAYRPRGQATLDQQVIAVATQQFLDRVGANRRRYRQHTQRRKIVRQRPHRLQRPIFHIPGRPTLGQIAFDHRLAQPADADPDGLHPAIRMRHEAHVLLGRGPRIPVPKQPSANPATWGSNGPRTNDRNMTMTLLSIRKRQASINSSDYADLGSTNPLPHR
jgi:hypothetical protein